MHFDISWKITILLLGLILWYTCGDIQCRQTTCENMINTLTARDELSRPSLVFSRLEGRV